ncbi:MAG: tyrosine-type recombinase/integrase, partial [bacterium]|nr:tyrosine-type recombinase/integrase [bacterium]
AFAAATQGYFIAKSRGWIAVVPEDWPTIRSDPPKLEQKGKWHPPEIVSAAFECLPPQILDKCLFTSRTGLRATEVERITLDWLEVAPPAAATPWLLRIPAAGAKSRKSRVVGITEEAANILRRRATDGKPTVFGKSNHGRALRQASKDIGYDKNITLRDLRHIFGTLAVQMTGDPWAALQVLGHSDLRVTSVYQ